MKNETIYLAEDQKFEYKETEIPKIGPKDVLVEIKSMGICGSDVVFFEEHTVQGALDYNLPIVLGHECAGVVVDKGNEVSTLEVGDRVALEPGIPCGECEYCKSGHYNLCRDVNFMAAPPFKSGAMSKYVKHPASWAFKLPENVSTVEGALLEPLSVGMYAVKRANPQPADTVTILGAGCIGLMTLLALKARGIDNIIMMDLFENRLEKAKEMGAKYCINSGKEDMAEAIMRLTGRQGTTYVFETAGNPVTTKAAAKIAKCGGKIVMVGQVHQPVDYDFFEINSKEVDILNVFRYANIYPMALESVNSGRIDVKQIVTDIYSWEEAQKAFDVALHNKQEVLKIVIEF